MAGIGPVKKPIDWDEVEKLLHMQCTRDEVVAFTGVSADTLNRRTKELHSQTFEEYAAEKRKGGFASLRRKQWQVAMSGNVTMLIFLGKNYLGQADKQEIKNDSTVTGELSVGPMTKEQAKQILKDRMKKEE